MQITKGNDMDYKVNVTTKFDASTIEQEVWSETINGIRETISIEVMNLQGQGIRDALIALGWTPPSEKDKG